MIDLKVSPDGRRFIDGTTNEPFLWRADTAWNAPLRGTPEEWDIYLSTRKRQGFNVIQFVTMPWHGCPDPVGGPAYTLNGGKVHFHEEAWAYLDRWFQAIQAHGLVAAPVILWGLLPDSPGRSLEEKQAIEIGRRQVERWNRPDVVWFLGGDAEYRTPPLAQRWQRIGREVFAPFPEVIATMHTSGLSWPGEIFSDEPWYRFLGIQGGHGYQGEDLRTLLQGPFSYRWRELAIPFLNLEPAYEFARPFYLQRKFTRHEVRRGLWWSVLSAPTTGVSYGNNSTWAWSHTKGENEIPGHGTHWRATPWRDGLETPGIEDLTAVCQLLQNHPWERLFPANEHLCRQPGDNDPNDFVKLSKTPEDDFWMAYLPTSTELLIADFEPRDYRSIEWWSPVGNTSVPAHPEKHYHLEIPAYLPPSPEGDWVWIAKK